MRDGRFARSQMNFELDRSKGQFIPGQQCAARDLLPVDFCAIGASQIPDEQQTVGPGNGAMKFGDAVVVQRDITQLPLSPDESQIPGDDDRFSSVEWNQFSRS